MLKTYIFLGSYIICAFALNGCKQNEDRSNENEDPKNTLPVSQQENISDQIASDTPKLQDQIYDQNRLEDLTIELTISPAAEPIPALKYELMPRFADQTPGNAADIYQQAFAMMAQVVEKHKPHDPNLVSQFENNLYELQKAPLTDENKILFTQTLDAVQDVLDLIEQGSHCEICDWQIPLRSNDVKRTFLNKFTRRVGMALAVKAHFQIENKQFGQAIETLKTGLTYSHHIACSGETFGMIVAIDISRMMLAQVEFLINSPDCPNLYWALSNLPVPFIDRQTALRYERDKLYIMFPVLRQIEKQKLTEKDASNLFLTLAITSMNRDNDYKSKPFRENEEQIIIQKLYRPAVSFLKDQGYSEQQIMSYAPVHAILIHQLHDLDNILDSFYKWSAKPGQQAYQGSETAFENLQVKQKPMHNILEDRNFGQLWLNMMDDFGTLQFDPERHQSLAHFITAELMGIGRFHQLTTRVNQKIAALQCVEAIRIHAAEHNILPPTLEDITSVPVPIDPMTHSKFLYQLDNGIAILTSSANPISEYPDYLLRYEIKLRN